MVTSAYAPNFRNDARVSDVLASRAVMVGLTAALVLSAAYLIIVSDLVSHNQPRIIVGWKPTDLSSSVLLPSSSGKIIETLTNGAENLSITASSSQLQREKLYGVTLYSGQSVNASTYPFLQFWVKTNSLYTGAVLGVFLDSGFNVTVLQKTYNDMKWHLEFIDLRTFGISSDISVIGLFMGFHPLSSQAGPPAVEFAQPAIEMIIPEPG